MMRPPPDAIMPRTAYLVSSIGASVFRWTSCSISLVGIVARMPGVPMAALLTSP